MNCALYVSQMLNGYHCGDEVNLSESHLEVAKRYVKNSPILLLLILRDCVLALSVLDNALYVGLSDLMRTSVCQFAWAVCTTAGRCEHILTWLPMAFVAFCVDSTEGGLLTNTSVKAGTRGAPDMTQPFSLDCSLLSIVIIMVMISMMAIIIISFLEQLTNRVGNYSRLSLEEEAARGTDDAGHERLRQFKESERYDLALYDYAVSAFMATLEMTGCPIIDN